MSGVPIAARLSMTPEPSSVSSSRGSRQGRAEARQCRQASAQACVVSQMTRNGACAKSTAPGPNGRPPRDTPAGCPLTGSTRSSVTLSIASSTSGRIREERALHLFPERAATAGLLFRAGAADLRPDRGLVLVHAAALDLREHLGQPREMAVDRADAAGQAAAAVVPLVQADAADVLADGLPERQVAWARLRGTRHCRLPRTRLER